MTQRDRDEERWAKAKREDAIRLVVGLSMLVITLVIAVVYGVYWWTHCAGVPFLDAPMLCHAGSSRR